MREELVNIIRSHADVLSEKLDIDGGLLNRLLAKGVITDNHRADIKAEKTRRRKNETLLEILQTRDDEFYAIFRDLVSKDQKQLADECLPLPDENLTCAVPEASQDTTTK